MASLQKQQLKAAFDLFGDSSDEGDHVEECIVQAMSTVRFEKSEPFLQKVESYTPMTCEPELWPQHPPQYMGPMQYVNSIPVGGGRGYVASEDIPPGTLLLIEKAFVRWPSERRSSSLFIDTVQDILRSEEQEDVIACITKIYPEALSDLPKDIYKAGLEEYSEKLSALRVAQDDCRMSFDSLLQLVLAMQSNAFSSGLFLHCSIFNHSCQPNCVKLNPNAAQPISQVRAARYIRKGEPLTISYLYPLEQSRSSRKKQLCKQFGFTCTCLLCETDTRITDVKFQDIEAQLPAAEELLQDNRPEQALALALELFADALEVCPHDASELMRIHKLVANSSAALLKQHNVQFLEHVILFLRSSFELYELQQKYLNKDHVDLAGTLNDMSQGIQMLLSHSPEALYAEFEEWSTFRTASIAENEYRKEYQRIKKLYQ